MLWVSSFSGWGWEERRCGVESFWEGTQGRWEGNTLCRCAIWA